MGKGLSAINVKSPEDYIYERIISEFREKIRRLRFGYIPGVILHHCHSGRGRNAVTSRIANNSHSGFMHSSPSMA